MSGRGNSTSSPVVRRKTRLSDFRKSNALSDDTVSSLDSDEMNEMYEAVEIARQKQNKALFDSVDSD